MVSRDQRSLAAAMTTKPALGPKKKPAGDDNRIDELRVQIDRLEHEKAR